MISLPWSLLWLSTYEDTFVATAAIPRGPSSLSHSSQRSFIILSINSSQRFDRTFGAGFLIITWSQPSSFKLDSSSPASGETEEALATCRVLPASTRGYQHHGLDFESHVFRPANTQVKSTSLATAAVH
jgi:hypothetical protein